MAKSFKVAEVLATVRQKLDVPASDGLLLYAGGNLLKSGEALIDVFDKHKDKGDGFLYLEYG